MTVCEWLKKCSPAVSLLFITCMPIIEYGLFIITYGLFIFAYNLFTLTYSLSIKDVQQAPYLRCLLVD